MKFDEKGCPRQCEISPPDKGEWSRPGEFVRAHTICSAGFLKPRLIDGNLNFAPNPQGSSKKSERCPMPSRFVDQLKGRFSGKRLWRRFSADCQWPGLSKFGQAFAFAVRDPWSRNLHILEGIFPTYPLSWEEIYQDVTVSPSYINVESYTLDRVWKEGGREKSFCRSVGCGDRERL